MKKATGDRKKETFYERGSRTEKKKKIKAGKKEEWITGKKFIIILSSSVEHSANKSKTSNKFSLRSGCKNLKINKIGKTCRNKGVFGRRERKDVMKSANGLEKKVKN